MDRISSIKNLKMTDLTFFKPDDTRKYSANYIQKQIGLLQEQEEIIIYIDEIIDDFLDEKK